MLALFLFHDYGTTAKDFSYVDRQRWVKTFPRAQQTKSVEGISNEKLPWSLSPRLGQFNFIEWLKRYWRKVFAAMQMGIQKALQAMEWAT